MTPKDPFLEGTFWDKFWRPIQLLGAFVHSQVLKSSLPSSPGGLGNKGIHDKSAV